MMKRRYDATCLVVALDGLVVFLERHRKESLEKVDFAVVRNGARVFASTLKCIDVVHVEFEDAFYRGVMERARGVLLRFGSDFVLSDVSFAMIDVVEYCGRHSCDGYDVAEMIIAELLREFGYECRVGVSGSFVVSRMLLEAEPHEKRIVTLSTSFSEVVHFCARILVDTVGFPINVTIGLAALGITSLDDVIKNRGFVRSLFNQDTCTLVFATAIGIDIGWSQPTYTIQRDNIDSTQLDLSINEMIQELCDQLRRGRDTVKYFQIVLTSGSSRSTSYATAPFPTCTRSMTSSILHPLIKSRPGGVISSLIIRASQSTIRSRRAQKSLLHWAVPGVTAPPPPPLPRRSDAISAKRPSSHHQSACRTKPSKKSGPRQTLLDSYTLSIK